MQFQVNIKIFKRNQSQKAGIGKVISKITKLLKKSMRSGEAYVKTAFHSKCQRWPKCMQQLCRLQGPFSLPWANTVLT